MGIFAANAPGQQHVKCQRCGTKVYRDKIPSCIDWCASARQCLGEERWKALHGEDEKEQVKQNDR